MKPVAEPAPARSREERSHRICAVARKRKAFSHDQNQKMVDLLRYSRDHHFKAVLFYARFGGKVADELESRGCIDELVSFEDEVFRLSSVDMEAAYRYYRDRFMELYDKAFPGASGPFIEEARAFQLKEHDEENSAKVV